MAGLELSRTQLDLTDFSEVFKPKPVGETVNVHVVPAVAEPSPDYEAMQRLIEGRDQKVPPASKAA